MQIPRKSLQGPSPLALITPLSSLQVYSPLTSPSNKTRVAGLLACADAGWLPSSVPIARTREAAVVILIDQ